MSTTSVHYVCAQSHKSSYGTSLRECVCVWHKMTELEKQNGDLRRQLDGQLYGSKPGVDHDNLDKLSHDDLARRYCMHRLLYLINLCFRYGHQLSGYEPDISVFGRSVQ